MTSGQYVLVIDCGSTNITISALTADGTCAASAGRPSTPTKHADGEGWYIWDTGSMWEKICSAAAEVCAAVDTGEIRAVTVTTFGADGTFLDKTGAQAYPVISWQCIRTEETAREITELLSPREIYDITGYNIIRFNTLLRMMWLKKHIPEVVDSADKWLMMPGIISHRLTGEMSIDATSAGTMMSLDLQKRTWSDRMLGLPGLDASIFPRWVEPGEIIGEVTNTASEATGIPAGVPVTAAGHDTQFALIGSGASESEAVLSSGTWEILMGRTHSFSPNDAGFENGLITECDAVPGMWNPQLLMMGSGALEWVRRNFYAAEGDDGIYDVMIGEANDIDPNASRVFFNPSFVAGTGPLQKFGVPGGLLGIEVTTSRGEVYRAALEGMAFQLRAALDVVKASTGFAPSGIRVVGGGGKNSLWNQIRADVTGLPVTVTSMSEITALGAALFAFTGTGMYSSITDAQAGVDYQAVTTEPGDLNGAYDTKFEQFMNIPAALSKAYKD